MKKIYYILILSVVFIIFIFSETMLYVKKSELEKVEYELQTEISERTLESVEDLWQLREDSENNLSELEEELNTEISDLREEIWRLEDIILELEIRVSRLEREEYQ